MASAQQTSMRSPRAVPEWLNSPVWYTKPTHPLQAEEGTRSAPVLNGDYERKIEGSPTEVTYGNEGKEEGNGCVNNLENEERSDGAQSSSLDNAIIQKTSTPDQSSFGRSPAFDTRVGLFIVELSRNRIHMAELQRLASQGIPDVGSIRATTWKLLLGYLPRNREHWDDEVAKKRSQYAIFQEEFLINPSEVTRRKAEHAASLEAEERKGLLERHNVFQDEHPLSLGASSVWHQFFVDLELAEQIERDVKRTHPDIQFFCGDSSPASENQEALKRALFIFAKLNPGVRYVQGMNEVYAPLYYVFKSDPDETNSVHAEADSFFCFVELLSDFRDHFCQQLDNSAVGIRSTISQLTALLKIHDEELWRHLESVSKVNPQFYAFRWITLLLTQEFNFPDSLRLWDSLLSNPDGPLEILLRVCCAMLITVRSRLLAGDFTANLKLLQHFPRVDIHHLLRLAKDLKAM